jgi:hypothetical protein
MESRMGQFSPEEESRKGEGNNGQSLNCGTSPELKKILNGGLFFAIVVNAVLFIIRYFFAPPAVPGNGTDLNMVLGDLSVIVLFGSVGAGTILYWYYLRQQQACAGRGLRHEVLRIALPLFSSSIVALIAGFLFAPTLQTKEAHLIFQLTTITAYAVLVGLQYWALSRYYGLEIRLWG